MRRSARGRGLREEDPGHHHRAAEPSLPPQHLVCEQHAEQRRERRLEREDERGSRCSRARLHPGGDEVAERAGEEPRHEERPHTVAPRGTSSSPRATAMTAKPANDVAICRNVSARGS